MRYAVNTPNFQTFADAALMADLAREAEAAGWDGFFVWDHMLTNAGEPVADPWVMLTAMALSTSRIRLGTMVTPLPRRRPWKLARETATLDRLSGGRLILGAGLGDDGWREYSAFGEDPDQRRHGEMANEALEVLVGLWSGEPFSFEGKHYRIEAAQFLPTPLQWPRIPVWVAAGWPAKPPLRRAARWDGVYPLGTKGTLTASNVTEILDYIRQHRTEDGPFDVTVGCWTEGGDLDEDREVVEPFAAAGVTWLQFGFWPDDTPEAVRARIRRGPPRL